MTQTRHTYDPQFAPEFWTRELHRMLDINGVEIVFYRDQDGDVGVMDAEEYDWTGRREP